MNFIFELIISFILGFLFFFIIDIISFKYFETYENIILTKGISTDEITYTNDYIELLSVRLGYDAGYHVTYGKSDCHILLHYWSIFDIKNWIESLNEQDYAVTFEIIPKDKAGLYLNNPRVILTREFMVNRYSDFTLISSLLSSQLLNFCKMFSIENDVDHYIIIHYKLLTAIK
jgi:hypothetical protein